MGSAPTNLVDDDSAPNSVLENAAPGTVVGVVAKATDVDGNKITYSLSGYPANLFAIDADTGVITTLGDINYESAASRTVTVTATDSTRLSTSKDFTINIVNVNEAPTVITDTNTATTVAKTAAINSVVGITAKATDPDKGDTIRYSLEDDAGGLFKINATSGVVTVAKTLDGLEHDIIVRATDAGDLSTTQTFHIGVNNTNIAPINLMDTNTGVNSVKLDAAAGTAVGITANAIDTNAGDKVTYSLSDNAGGLFAIDAKGVITVTGKQLTEGTHNVTVQATDNAGLHMDKTFAINVGNTIHVSTAAELTSALKMATGGETILLKAGVEFGALVLANQTNYSSTVTIKSENVNDQAIFERISLGNVKNLTIDSIKIETPETQTYGPAFNVQNSSYITLKNSDLDGNLPMGVEARAKIPGTDIRGTDHITLDGNTFHNFLNGTAIGNTDPSSYITVINNTYYDNLNDNSQFGSNISHVLIENNTYYAPDASRSQAYHSDFIQFWVEKDAIQNSSNIVIRGNFIYDNLGAHSQAIFMRGDYNQPDANGNLANRYRLENVTIENNVVNSQNMNAIFVSGVEGLVVNNNVLHYAGDSSNPDLTDVPTIFTRAATNVSITDNILPSRASIPKSDNDIWQGNVFFNVGDGSASNYLMNPGAENATKEDFASLKVAALMNADGNYKGAAVATANTDHPTAIFTRNSEVVNEHYQHTFDASLSLAREGSNLNGATYKWTFSDGTTAEGITVSKTFNTLGSQEVKLTVTDSRGHSDTVTNTLNIKDEVGVKMNFDGRFIDLSSTESIIEGVAAPIFVDTPYGGKALSLGANNNHIYIEPKNDPDLSGMQELTIAYSMQAAKIDNTNMVLGGSHGVWSVGLTASTNTFNVSIGGVPAVKFVPATNILDNQWHDIAMTASKDTFTIYIDGKSVYTQKLTQAQSNAIFNTDNAYGLHVGASGPWVADPNIKGAFEGNIDNLHIGSVALSAKSIEAMHVQNTTVNTAPLPVNHAPFNLVDTDNKANVIAEDRQVGAAINITAQAEDTDAGDKITYSLVDDKDGNFKIDPNTGVIELGKVLDYETAQTYNVTVKASDLGGMSITKTFTLDLTDVDDGPGNLKDIDQAGNAIAINSPIGTGIGVTAFAPGNSTGKVTYKLSNTEDNKYFSIDADTGVVTLASAPDETGTLKLRIEAVDPTGGKSTLYFTVNVVDGAVKPNSAPINLTDTNAAANTVSEKAAIGSLVGITANAMDPDGTTLTYSLTDNAGGRFAINSTTGEVSVAGAFDYKTATSHNISVRASDGELSVQKVFNIGVANPQQATADTSAPTNLVDKNTTTNTIAENAAVGTAVGLTAQATDASALTYSLTDSTGGKFAINASTGVVTVASALDYETATSHNITVKATDAGGLSTTQTFAIGVTNVNEAPVNLADSNTVTANSVAENAAVGTAVGITAKATDPDAGNTIKYSLTDTAGGKFAIDETTGVVTVASALDYETVASHNITVKATDAGGLSTSQTFAVGVTDVNEGSKTILVSTDAELKAALASATGGETILLKTGVDFGQIKIWNPTKPYTSEVTIRSQDVDHPSTVASVSLTGASNLTIDSVHIDIPAGANTHGVAIYTSSNITIKNSEVDGNLQLGVPGQALLNGVTADRSTNITVEESEFHNLKVGVTMTEVTNVVIKGNEFHDNLSDNIVLGYNLTNILVEKNNILSLDPKNPFNAHQDNLQIFTKGGSQNSVGITIRDNFILDLGDGYAHAMFVTAPPTRMPDGTTVQFRYENLLIENNIIATTNSHGITVQGADDLTIKNNTLVYHGSETNPAELLLPAIGVTESTDVVVTANIVPAKYGYHAVQGFAEGHNIIYNHGTGELSKLLANPYVQGADLTREDFATLRVAATQLPDGSYMGAATINAAVGNPTAIFTRHFEIVNEHYQHTFDASLSLAQEGSNLNGATYKWTFSDGSTAEGITVSKTFTTLGLQEVKLTVTDSKGNSDTTNTKLSINDEVGVKMNFDGRFIDLSSTESIITGVEAPIFVDTPYGGKALSLGANNDHIYIEPKSDRDLGGMQELTIAYSMQAAKIDNTNMVLGGSQGVWGVGLTAATNTFNVSIGGVPTVKFVPATNILDNQWHDIAMTASKDTFTIYIDGKSVYTQKLTQAQSDAIFNTDNTYGLHIGSSGPWKVDPNIRGSFEGNIDNLHIGSVALGAQSIAAMHIKNTTANTEALPVNHAPFNLIDSDNNANIIAEDKQAGLTINITAHAEDTDAGDRITYSLVDNEKGYFIIDPNTGIIEVAKLLDYETAQTHNVTVKATDLGGASVTKTFTLDLTDIKDGPGDIKDINQKIDAVAINSPIGSEIGVTAFAPGGSGGKVTYKLSDTDHNKYFSIDGDTGVITLTSAPEKIGTLKLNVLAVDETGGTSKYFTVNVVDGAVKPNSAPINLTDTDAAANTVSEKAAIGSLVGITANAMDPDGTTLTYSLTDNAGGRFAINSITGEVSVAGAFDYKTATNHNITVRATDGELSVQKVFNIGVANPQQATADTSAPTNLVDNNTTTNTIAESAAVGTAVGLTAQATDASALTYSLTDTAGGKFAIDETTGVVTVASALDYEMAASHNIIVKATDAGNLSTTQTFAIGVANVNEAPVNLADSNTATANSVAENAAVGTAVGITAKATDPDAGNTIKYSLTDTAGGKFAIDETTGVVTVASALDYETATSHNITVKATDAGNLSTTQTFAVVVTNVNEAPMSLVDSNTAANTVAENAAVGTVVGITAKATDPDAGNTLTYSLTDNAGGKFAINASTGVVTVASGLDYETAASHNIIVKATDAAGLSTSQTFAIGVTNMNEAPVNLADSNTAANSVAQSADIGTVVGIMAQAIDPDANTTLTYSLTDNAGGKFAIDAITGVVKVAGALDNTPSHKITVEAKDAGGLVTTQTFTIGVTDIYQTPTDPNAPANLVDGNAFVNSVKEDATIGAIVGITASATAPGALTYSLTDNAEGKFAINASTGVVSVAGVLDYETASSHNITVKATDAANESTSQTFTIGLTNVNEAPTDVVDGNGVANTIDKKAEIGTSVGIAAQAIDPDAGDTFTYSLTTNPNNLFAIDAKTGLVTVARPLGDVTSYTITVTATDAEGLTIVRDFTIVVTEDVEDESIELIGTIGDDTLVGARNGDVLSGNMGADVITGDAGNDTLKGNRGADQVYGGEGDDTVLGGKGHDMMNGNTGEDTLDGQLGNDTVGGGKGNDLVYGGQGDDMVRGGLGNDTVSGDMGRDYLMGGTGSDVFAFARADSTMNSFDTIGDFTTGEDKIDLVEYSFSRVVIVSSDPSAITHDADTLLIQATTTADGGTLLSNAAINFAVKLEGNQYIQSTDFLM